jgi:hypothetical protein
MVTNKLVALDSQSDTYKEIEKLVLGTWESSTVGHDTDVAGLHHGSVAVRKIWRVESPVLYRQYEEKRKLMCMTKTVNSYPVFCGLGGEREVVTRTLGTFYFVTFWDRVKENSWLIRRMPFPKMIDVPAKHIVIFPWFWRNIRHSPKSQKLFCQEHTRFFASDPILQLYANVGFILG